VKHAQNLARKLKRAVDVFQQRGVVTRADGAAVWVDTGDATYEARRAMSCLIAPLAGDVVLLGVGEDGGSHVLAVLDREGGEPAQIAVDRDLTVALPRGRFTVAAQEGICLATAGEATVASRSVSVTAAEGRVSLDRLAYLGRHLRAEVTHVRHVGTVLDAVLERVSQRVKRSFRRVEEVDQVRADQIDYTAKNQLGLHGHDAFVTAEQLVKVDGEQIHVG
jgi:hypothetical protein